MSDFIKSLGGLASAALSASALYGLISLGFSISFRVSGFFDLSLGVAFMVAGYAAYVATVWFGLSLPAAMVAGAVIAAAVSVIVGLLVIGPLSRRLEPLSMFVATLAMLYIAQSMIALLFDERVRVLRPDSSPAWGMGGLRLTDVQIALILVSALSLTAIVIALTQTSWGSHARALADDPVLAANYGFPVRATRLRSYAIAGALAGLAGIFYAADRALDPTQAMAALLAAMVAAILGGDSIAGALIGAACLAILETGLGFALPGNWKTASAFGVLLVLLALRGQGAVTVVNRRL